MTLEILDRVLPTAQDAVAHLVAAEGDLDLAAERLYGRSLTPKDGALHKSQLVQLIAEDPTAALELQRQFRTLTLLQTFNTTRLVGATVEGTLDKLPAADRAKLYTGLLSALSALTDEHSSSFNANINSTSLNVSEQIFRQLPPEIRENLKVLMAAPIDGGTGEVGDEVPSPISLARWSGGDEPPNAAR